MPASLGVEELLLELFLKKAEWTATKSYLGMQYSLTIEKKTTEKECKEKEITEANGWKRKELDALEWEVTKSEGATGFTTFKNKNAIELVAAAKEIKEERKLETFTVKKEALQANDKAESKNVFIFGKLTIPVTLNEATSKFEIPAKEMIVECE
jgi:hypothetical protein